MADRRRLKKWLERNLLHSIRGQYTRSIIIGIFASAIMVGVITAFMVHAKAVRDTAATMDLHCRREGDAVNDALSSVQQSVSIMQQYAQLDAPDVDSLMTSRKERDAYLERLISLEKEISGVTEGCMSYFFRFNPEDFPGDEGFLYAMEYGGKTLSDGFSEMSFSPLTEESAKEELWFARPVELGTGAWITPHYSSDLEMSVITYAAPVYIAGKIAGVIGMDLDFDNVVQKIGKNRLYATGEVFLVGTDGSVMGASGTSDTKEAELFADHLVKFSSNGETYAYTYQGHDKRMVYCTLTNAMKLVITAHADEIFREERQLLQRSTLVAALIALLLAVIGFQHARLLTRPLRHLEEAAAKVDGKNFRIDLPGKDRQDEIGGLARTLQDTMDKAQEYSDYIEGLAYKDSLTGINNKAAYDTAEEELNGAIRSGKAAFAIVMVDLNFLKRVNDTYGHGIGNQYILALCDRIIRVFPEKDIYRIGGDEFVVIVAEAMYDELTERVETLRRELSQENNNAKEPWENVSAAVGCAVYDGSMDRDVKAVFDRADEDMYAHKLAMKGARS